MEGEHLPIGLGVSQREFVLLVWERGRASEKCAKGGTVERRCKGGLHLARPVRSTGGELARRRCWSVAAGFLWKSVANLEHELGTRSAAPSRPNGELGLEKCAKLARANRGENKRSCAPISHRLPLSVCGALLASSSPHSALSSSQRPKGERGQRAPVERKLILIESSGNFHHSAARGSAACQSCPSLFTACCLLLTACCPVLTERAARGNKNNCLASEL